MSPGSCTLGVAMRPPARSTRASTASSDGACARSRSRTGLSNQYLSQMENEKLTCPPSEEVIDIVARALELSPNDLARLFGRVPKLVQEYLLQTPGALEAIEVCAVRRVSGDRLLSLVQTR